MAATTTCAVLVSGTACGSFSESEPPAAETGPAEASAEGGDVPDGAVPGDASVTDALAADSDADAAPHLVAFVTSVGHAGVTTAAAADTFCRSDAEARLTGRFVAWFSTATVAAPARLVDSKSVLVNGPWFRPDGKRIVASRAALLSSASAPLESAINVTPTGATTNGGVWTGTRADGTIGVACPSSGPPTTGSSGRVDVGWTDQTGFTASCSLSTSLALYCFQVE
jgi:hypothetical protein